MGNELKELLQEAHDKMDDVGNWDTLPFGCSWCQTYDPNDLYGYNGLHHEPDCILVRMRKVLSHG